MIREQAYQVEVEALEPVRIGGAPDPLSGQDNPVAIVGSDATIPGSSLKGALRGEIERFLIDRYYDGGGGRWPPDQLAAQPCLAATRLSPAEQQLRDSHRYRQSCTYPVRQDASGICPACYLLGAQGLVGFVKVPFLWCQVSPDALYSARVDRSSGTVSQGTNREYQLLPRGTRFGGALYLLEEDTARGWRLGQDRPLPGDPDRWLKLGWEREQITRDLLVERLQTINYLGGYKSKGMGRVRITVRAQGA
jgi:CRISPR/Cas system CSM-associated protein Csm3 (group 7 of RAMP superfamily)